MKPMIRGGVCLNAHPEGCAKETERQIAIAAQRQKSREAKTAPRAVLVVGASTGYGLASRIVSAFGYGSAVFGVSLERPPRHTRSASPGWYNNAAFDAAAARQELVSVAIDADAFSDAAKQAVADAAKERGIVFDLVVYSVAAGVRVDPVTGETYTSALKPIAAPFCGSTLDAMTGTITPLTAQCATEQEIAHTVKVMGGEDWQRWLTFLSRQGVLAPDCVSAAYSYIGPPVSYPIYRDGTIGKAKAHLEQTAAALNAALDVRAFVCVNKGVVTRSSAVIPVTPLYLSILFKVMKAAGTHEGCIEQIDRLFAERLYGAAHTIPVDTHNRIRIDDREMAGGVQEEVASRLARVTEQNVAQLADVQGYRHDFLAVHGFDIAGVNYA